MSIVLLTQPSLLRTRFAYTRRRLLGLQTAKQVQGLANSRLQPVLPEIEEISVPSVKTEQFPELPALAKVADTVIEDTNSKEASRKADFVAPTPFQAKIEARRSQITPWWKSMTKGILTIVMIVTLGLAAVIIVPEVYFSVFSSQSAVADVASEALSTSQAKDVKPVVEQPYMPEKDESLPEGTWLSIPSIGVDSEARATANPDEALDLGVWMVPDFGRPGDYTQPTILAAHRFGWDWWWQSDFWKLNSFYLLPDTQVGDRIEVIYDQRKWVYEIYSAEEGELISDYDADLILYTCKYLNSPVRYFRYAKVVKE